MCMYGTSRSRRKYKCGERKRKKKGGKGRVLELILQGKVK